MNALTINLCWLVPYLTGFVFTSRAVYRADRPYTEPLKCKNPKERYHSRGCYGNNTKDDATMKAFLVGLIWFIVFPIYFIGKVFEHLVSAIIWVIQDDRPRPEELKVKADKEVSELLALPPDLLP